MERNLTVRRKLKKRSNIKVKNLLRRKVDRRRFSFSISAFCIL